MSAEHRSSGKRRAAIALALGLVVGTPLVASGTLRDLLRGTAVQPSAREAEASPQQEVVAIELLLGRVRGTNLATCEMAMMAVDRRGWYGWHAAGMSPLAPDSVQLSMPGEIQSTAAVGVLAAALDDADSCVRRTAASLFGRARSPRASERLRATLDAPGDEQRALAAFALGLAQDSAAGPKLQALLLDGSATVRATAAWALGEMEFKAAIPALTGVLERDLSPRVRRAAAKALGEIG